MNDRAVDTDGRRPRWPAFLLLLTVPLAFAASAVLMFVVTLSWCGVSGCSGGGFGRISDPSLVGALFPSLITGILWFAALALPPWGKKPRARVIVGAIIGLLAAAVVLLGGTDFFVRD